MSYDNVGAVQFHPDLLALLPQHFDDFRLDTRLNLLHLLADHFFGLADNGQVLLLSVGLITPKSVLIQICSILQASRRPEPIEQPPTGRKSPSEVEMRTSWKR